MWGPIAYGPGPFTRREFKGPNRRGLWPKPNNVKHRMALRYRRGPLSPRQTQKSHRREGQKRYRTKFERKSKISGKAALTVTQCSAPDRAAFFDFYNHPQRLWVWADGTSISLGKFDPTRGRRTANIGQYKRESKWPRKGAGKNGQKPEPPSPPLGERLQGWRKLIHVWTPRKTHRLVIKA